MNSGAVDLAGEVSPDGPAAPNHSGGLAGEIDCGGRAVELDRKASNSTVATASTTTKGSPVSIGACVGPR